MSREQMISLITTKLLPSLIPTIAEKIYDFVGSMLTNEPEEESKPRAKAPNTFMLSNMDIKWIISNHWYMEKYGQLIIGASCRDIKSFTEYCNNKFSDQYKLEINKSQTTYKRLALHGIHQYKNRKIPFTNIELKHTYPSKGKEQLPEDLFEGKI